MNDHSSQEVCPWNQRFVQVAAERDYAVRDAWEAEWDAYTRGSAMRRAGYAGLRRNVVAALSDEDPVVAEAAAWALRRVNASE